MNNIEKFIDELSQFISDKLCDSWQTEAGKDSVCVRCPYTDKCRPSFNAMNQDIKSIISEFFKKEN